MGGTFTSLGALKAAIKKEVEEAMQETMEKSYKDAKDNVGNFYAAPEGDYHRTGALRESPTIFDIVSMKVTYANINLPDGL